MYRNAALRELNHRAALGLCLICGGPNDHAHCRSCRLLYSDPKPASCTGSHTAEGDVAAIFGRFTS